MAESDTKELADCPLAQPCWSKSPSLLITDDDSDFRETLQVVFEPQGFRTLLAGDGEEALHIVRHEEVHLLLLDMHMPKLTGLETLAAGQAVSRRCCRAFCSRPNGTNGCWRRPVASRRFRCCPNR